MTAKLYIGGLQGVEILRSVTAKLISDENTDANQILHSSTAKSQTNVDKLINQLSFSHIIELLKADTELKRSFYEAEAIKNH